MTNLWIIFLTGLTVGGLTCLAVQGGLLASVIAAREEEEVEKGVNTKNQFFPTLAFLLTKLIVYTILGFILGAFGGTININNSVQVTMQFVAGLYMVVIALNLLNVHPIFRYALIQPPKFLVRKIRNQSKSKDLFAPALLGAMTIFIPCGTTLAMETLAISSANPITGALIMAVFVLGTTPLFFGIGFLTAVLGDNFRGKFLKIAAIAVLYLGLTSINGSLVISGSPITFQNLAQNSPIQISFDTEDTPLDSSVEIAGGVQSVEIKVKSNGYSPNYFKVRKDQSVRINLRTTNVYSCASAFRIPALGIVKNLPPNGEESVEFTPRQTGKIAFSCSMGMYSGIIEVI